MLRFRFAHFSVEEAAMCAPGRTATCVRARPTTATPSGAAPTSFAEGSTEFGVGSTSIGSLSLGRFRPSFDHGVGATNAGVATCDHGVVLTKYCAALVKVGNPDHATSAYLSYLEHISSSWVRRSNVELGRASLPLARPVARKPTLGVPSRSAV